MAKTGKQGRTAIRSSIAELEKAGYIHRQVVRSKAGRITGTEYLVYEDAEAERPCVTTTGVGCSKVSSSVESGKIHPDPPELGTTNQVKTSTRDKNQSHEYRSQETAPVINTNIEQILRVTTTTTPDPEPAPVVEIVAESSQSYPATEDINSLLNLIPEQHRQPMVMSLVNQAVKEYSPLELEEAIVYASANVRGGAMQYKAYLDKTLKNQWAAGYLETVKNQPTTPAMFSPGGFTGGMPAGKFPNGTVTGCARMDSNYMAAAQFLTEMGVEA